MMAALVLRGQSSVDRISELTAQLGMQHPMLVAGQRLSAVFTLRTGQACPVFSGYHPNPDFADCAAGAAMYRDNGCDGLISIGGGSAMDTAKGVKAMLLASTAEDALAYHFSDEKVPHIAIPATAGTGAEATQFAVVYLQGMKHSLSHPSLLPEGVVLDASLLDTLPVYHKKSCALDALCQGIESYWSVGATQESRVHASAAIRGVLGRVRAYMAGGASAATDMLEAAYRSGQAIQISRTTAAHAMSYRLTHHFGVAHGHACMLTLPVLWDMMLQEESMQPVLQELAGIMGLAEASQGSQLLRGLMLELEMEVPALPDKDVLDDLTASVNAERLGNHPQKMTQTMLRDVYVQALTPMSEAQREACRKVWAQYGQA